MLSVVWFSEWGGATFREIPDLAGVNSAAVCRCATSLFIPELGIFISSQFRPQKEQLWHDVARCIKLDAG